MNVLDEKVLSELKGLMGDDYITIFEAFVRSADQSIPDLNHAVDANDLKKIEIIVHTLKGSSANIGAKKLSQICAEMLDGARNSITDRFNTYLESINSEYDKVKESIKGLTQ